MDNYTSPKEGRLSCRMPALLAAGEGTTDLAGDFVLPEYRPEIQRLLDARVTVSPADVYLSAAGCEVGGTVEYRILYCGGDHPLIIALTHPAYCRAFSAIPQKLIKH